MIKQLTFNGKIWSVRDELCLPVLKQKVASIHSSLGLCDCLLGEMVVSSLRACQLMRNSIETSPRTHHSPRTSSICWDGWRRNSRTTLDVSRWPRAETLSVRASCPIAFHLLLQASTLIHLWPWLLSIITVNNSRFVRTVLYCTMYCTVRTTRNVMNVSLLSL